ncbi:single-stranded DNA-binding protein [Streptosporangium sandarakinum]|uniref:single-stranded DNA-binding protein n=1 Tax=Streptosporangium sandarakinum TaxID=1260955 RepID=UPI0036AC3D20
MDRNEVVLAGRLPEAASVRKLRSGSALTRWRLIVRRQQRDRRTQVDTIPCASFVPEVALAAAGWLPGDMVEVTGSLRRRWWGDDGSKASGYEVEVHSVRHLGPAPGAAPAGDRGGERAAAAAVRPPGSTPARGSAPGSPVRPGWERSPLRAGAVPSRESRGGGPPAGRDEAGAERTP